MTKSLPESPNLEQLKNQAKTLLTSLRSFNTDAIQLLKEFHPEFSSAFTQTIQSASLTLSDAQLIVAREYGYASWPRLKKYIESIPLHGKFKAAIDSNDAALVKQLIRSNSALLNAPIGYDGQGALTWAAECRGDATPPTEDRLEIARFLIKSGADVHEKGDGPLMRAALNAGRIPMMELLLEHGADIHAHWAGFYPIILAPCETMNPVSLRWLLEHGADPNAQSTVEKDYGTPLDMVIATYARSREQRECIRILIEAGGKSKFSHSPSIFIHQGNLEALKAAIISDNSILNRRFPELDYGSTGARNLTLKGSTLLHVAAEYGNLDSAKMLVFMGADVNAAAQIDHDGIGGQSPLFHAVTQFNDFGIDVARFLIESGADLTLRARVPSGYDLPEEWVEVTPLGYAARFPGKQWETGRIFDLLREFDAPAGDVYAASKLGLTEELKHLLDSDGDPNSSSPYGETALEAAVKFGHHHAAELLISAGAIKR